MSMTSPVGAAQSGPGFQPARPFPTAEQRAHAEACATECRAISKQLADAVCVPLGKVDHARVEGLMAKSKSAGKRWHEALVAIGAFDPAPVWNAIAAGDVREVSKLTVGAP